MARVVHFEIPADNPERVSEFYSKVFGWEIVKWEGPLDYWLVMTGDEQEPGIDGGIVRREERPVVTNTIDVTSVDDYLDKIEVHGGKIVEPKTVVPGVGYLAYFQDTEGNTFGIMQSDESATI